MHPPAQQGVQIIDGRCLCWKNITPIDSFFERFLFFDVDRFFFKSLLNLFQYCFCFMFGGGRDEGVRCDACRILAPNQGLNPYPLHWKGKP